jgi:tRNA pseudouridine32 synthase/23S rRNA pseudouridine746 synthase
VITLSLFAPLALQPTTGALPTRLANPFEAGAPHPLARQAAEVLQGELAALPAAQRDDLALGKMLGVLVARDAEGRVGVLRAFAGMLAGRWDVDGFVGPVFDLAERNAVWPDTERELREFAAALDELASGPRTTALRAQLKTLTDRQKATERDLKARHEARRAARHAEREVLLPTPASPERHAALLQLARDSNDDRLEGRRLRATHAAERADLQGALRAGDQERAAIRRRRKDRSCEVLERLRYGYRIASARGDVRSLFELFAPHTPAGGAGDCAGPKLFAHAQREGLQPLALAEFWWGAPSKGDHGDREPGVYYPSCREKCGPVLTHMLQGWPVEGDV